MSKRNRIEELVGFHISHDEGRIRGNRGVTIVPGTTYKATGRLKMCEVGCHGSLTLEDAHSFRRIQAGRVVSLVRITGDVRVGERKVMGRYRKVLASKRIATDPGLEEVEVWVPGAVDKVTADVVPQSYFKKLHDELHAQYKRNKRRIDGSDIVVDLKARE